MTFARVAVVVGTALLVLVVNVVLSILYMVVYAYVINPGNEKKYYDDHVQVAAPYCSIVAGIPLMFLAGWWVGGIWDALIVWLAYAVIDLAILAAAGVDKKGAGLVAVSLVTKLAAVYVGAMVAGRGG